MSDEWKNSLCWNAKITEYNVPNGCTVEMSPIGHDKIDEINIFRPTTNHNMVICRAFNTEGKPIYETSAKCGPNDVFDFNIGAKLAFDRLYEDYNMTPKPKRKKYTGLIYIVFNTPSTTSFPNKTSSHVYKVKNGRLVDTGLIPCHNEDDFLIYDDMTEKALCETLNELYFLCNHIVNAGYLNIHDQT